MVLLKNVMMSIATESKLCYKAATINLEIGSHNKENLKKLLKNACVDSASRACRTHYKLHCQY